jgi:F-type H+-transporting ATPase subunit gamma
MPQTKDIRNKIKSVKKTQTITYAMQMVASSKMRKCQERQRQSFPYSQKIKAVVSHAASSNPEYRHPYLTVHKDTKKIGYIVVSTDRGLCGGLNANLFRKVLEDASRWQAKGVEAKWCLIGAKAQSFFKHIRADVVASLAKVGELPEIAKLIGSVHAMLDAYQKEEIDRIFIAYNHFQSSMSYQPSIEELVPLTVEKKPGTHHWDYIYEPEPISLINALLVRYLEMVVYQAVIENIACEQSARMIAMKNATDNAIAIGEELKLLYNKARQASITQEIAEVVGGSEALF